MSQTTYKINLVSDPVICIFCNQPGADMECAERIHGIDGDAHEDCYQDFAKEENKALVRFMQGHGIKSL